MKRLALLALLLASSTVFAEPDLRVHHMPVQLKMPPRPPTALKTRPSKWSKVTSTGATSTGATSTGATSTGATSTGATSTGATSTRVAQATDPSNTDGSTSNTEAAAAEGTNAPTIDPYAESSLTSFTPIPKDLRDWQERVTLKIRAGVELDGAGTSGDTLRGGASLPDNFAASRPWIVGDAVVGVRDILTPSLGAYFLSSFQLDVSDSAATRSAFVRPYDSDDAYAVAIKAGYAEWGRDDKHPNQKFWLRGGRQFRLDGGSMFAYFDGATAGYRSKGFEASGFVGQRVALYVDTPKGILFGGTASVDFKKTNDLPARVAIDYMGLAVDAAGVMGANESVTRQMAAVTGSYEIRKQTKLDVRARFVDAKGLQENGSRSGFVLGRIGARVRHERKNLIVLADVEHRDGGDLAYDLASPSAVDVVSVSRQLGVGLAAPVSATTVGVQVDYRRKDTELLVFGRMERPDAIGDVVSVDQRGWIESGVALAGSPLGNRAGGLYATAQYKLRRYDDTSSCDAVEIEPTCMMTGRNDGVGAAFGDSSTSGLEQMQEVAIDATLRSMGKGPRRWRFQLGGFYRVYDFGSPYADVVDEGRGGGRADLQYWISRDLRVDVAAELAEPSPVLARELGVMSAVRGAVEVRW
jgi:hypothetical protein